MKRKFCLVFAALIITLFIAPYSFSEPIELSDAQMSEVEGELLFIAPTGPSNYGLVSGHISGRLHDVAWIIAGAAIGKWKGAGAMAVVDIVLSFTEEPYHDYICSGKAGWRKLFSSTNKSWGITWWHIRIHDVPYL